jgi:antitoxin ParD1/3/4
MTVNLGEHFDQMVADLIASGRFQNQSEVIRAGLRLLENLEYFQNDALEQELVKRLDRSSKPLNNELFARIKKRGRERLKQQKMKRAA